MLNSNSHPIGVVPQHGAGYVFPSTGGITSLPASYEGLTAPERMVLVMRRFVADPETDAVTEDDFLEAAETCDLSPGELRENIGAAKRLFEAERLLRNAEARAERRLADARAIVSGRLPTAGEVHTDLRNGGFSNAEIAQMWPALIAQSADDWDHRLAPPTGTAEVA